MSDRERCPCGGLVVGRITARTPRGGEGLCGPCRARMVRAEQRRARALAVLDALADDLGWGTILEVATVRASRELSDDEGAIIVGSSRSGVHPLPERFR